MCCASLTTLQVCTIILKVRKLETSVLQISPANITMESDTVLTQYIIKKWSLDFINPESEEEGIKLTIVFRRRIMNAVLTVYLPTVLILTIVYATNFFKDFFFEAVVTVNLTALLVLTTLFISVSGALPQTAYIKMVDIWLIFAQMIPWIEVLVHTCIDLMRSEGEEGREVNHHGKSIIVGGEAANEKEEEEAYKELFKKRNKDFVKESTMYDVPDSGDDKSKTKKSKTLVQVRVGIRDMGR